MVLGAMDERETNALFIWAYGVMHATIEGYSSREIRSYRQPRWHAL